jgi:hypothetical protein
MIPKSVIDFLVDWCIECDDMFTIDDDDEPNATRPCCLALGHHRALTGLDWVWKICDRCKGHGQLSGYPGAYTQDEFDEAFGHDPDEYLNFRRDCEDCNGTGKARDLTDEAYARPIVQQALNEHYEMEATYRMEMRHCL